MDLNSITVADFKALFLRDFPYLPVYDNTALYNAGTRVYYPTTKLFYDCKKDGTTGVTPVTVTDPITWLQVADDINNYVQDADITKAFAEAQIGLNQGLFGTDDQIKLGYLYLTAHYLVNDLRASQGGMNGAGSFPVTSRSVGSVSESYGVPQAYMDNPLYSFYVTSAYGLKYLALVLPNLVGNMTAVCGGTRA